MTDCNPTTETTSVCEGDRETLWALIPVTGYRRTHWNVMVGHVDGRRGLDAVWGASCHGDLPIKCDRVVRKVLPLNV